MLRRANDLVERARERIRLAAERDLHTWPVVADDRELFHTHDAPAGDGAARDGAGDGAGDGGAAGSTAAPKPTADERIAGGDVRPPLGSPEPGALDVDDAPHISGPPDAAHAGSRRRFLRGGPEPDGDTVPSGLRTAAAWSWRIILVGG